MTYESSKRGRQHHTFLFRHCVRSTKSKVKLYNGDTKASTHIADYIAKPLPKWNTPDEWCTETAIEIMKNTGGFLVDTIFVGDDRANKRIKLRFISDTSQRDVDTSLALSLGMTAASLKYKNFLIDGLSNLRLDHALFHPFDNRDYSRTTRCDKYYKQNQIATDIEHRLKIVPPPDSDLFAALTLLQHLGGKGDSSLFSIEPPSEIYLNRTEMKLAGAINVIKLLAQMLFYSRAGGIDPPFLHKATLETVYEILEWVHWSRSVLSVDNVEIATQGAVISEAILQSLEDGHLGEDTCASDYDICATVFVGHDSTIDAVATALALRWKLKPPYRSGRDSIGEYLPTPPGGAMHFVHDERVGSLQLAYIYPVYFSGKGSQWVLNKTGILESVPMTLKLPIESSTTSRSSETATLISSVDSFPFGMRKRMLSILTLYPGSNDCYKDILNITSISSSPEHERLHLTFAGIVVRNLFLVMTLIVCTFLICKRILTYPRQAEYSNVLADDVHVNIECVRIKEVTESTLTP